MTATTPRRAAAAARKQSRSASTRTALNVDAVGGWRHRNRDLRHRQGHRTVWTPVAPSRSRSTAPRFVVQRPGDLHQHRRAAGGWHAQSRRASLARRPLERTTGSPSTTATPITSGSNDKCGDEPVHITAVSSGVQGITTPGTGVGFPAAPAIGLLLGGLAADRHRRGRDPEDAPPGLAVVTGREAAGTLCRPADNKGTSPHTPPSDAAGSLAMCAGAHRARRRRPGPPKPGAVDPQTV